MRGRAWLLAGMAVAALVAGVVVGKRLGGGAEDPNPLLQRATVLFGQEQALPDFELTDHHGQPFNAQRLKGRWSFLFFGYTHCPDVCPVTLGVMGQAIRSLAASGAEELPAVYFVSVDPERDSAERLARYVPYFHPDFLGITGSAEQIGRLARALGVLHRRVENPAGGGGYLVDHSASVLLVNPRGNWHAVFSAPHEAPVMVEDFKTIRATFPGG